MINYKKIFIEKKVIFILLIILLIIIDQFTKHIAMNSIKELIEKTNGIHSHIKYTNFFNLVLVYNNGISFGIFNNLFFMKNILFVIITLITAFLCYLLYKSNDKINNFSYSFIIGGAIGNLIDRVNYGAVIDFLDFHIGDLHWPAFNIADSCVFIGVFIYLFFDFIVKRKTTKQ